jgi:hypothetical protein
MRRGRLRKACSQVADNENQDSPASLYPAGVKGDLFK